MVAYHEAGHTIVGLVLLKNAHVVHKVTIVPRGRAGGYMIALPKEDQMLLSKEDKERTISRFDVGGRVAEEIILTFKQLVIKRLWNKLHRWRVLWLLSMV